MNEMMMMTVEASCQNQQKRISINRQFSTKVERTNIAGKHPINTARVARWYIFKPEIQIWVNLAAP
jgi:hypothetical protein